MADEAKLTASRSQIAAALDEWDSTAEEEGWPRSKEPPEERADYLMMLLRKHGAG